MPISSPDSIMGDWIFYHGWSSRLMWTYLWMTNILWQASHWIEGILQAFPNTEEVPWSAANDASHRWGISRHYENSDGKVEGQEYLRRSYLTISDNNLRQMIGEPFLVGWDKLFLVFLSSYHVLQKPWLLIALSYCWPSCPMQCLPDSQRLNQSQNHSRW